MLRFSPAPNFVGDLEHWHYDTFRVKWRDQIVYPFPKGFVTFTLDAQGAVGEMKIDLSNPDFNFDELEFKRVPESEKQWASDFGALNQVPSQSLAEGV